MSLMRLTAARGPGRWLRPLGYALLLIAVQGALSRLLAGTPLPPPNLFLLTGVALVGRASPRGALLGAYGVGLAQDVLGGGVLGWHAAGVAAGALAVLALGRAAVDLGPVRSALTVLAATVGQWLAFLVLTYWLRSDLVTADALLRTAPLALLTTLLASPVWERAVAWGLGPPNVGPLSLGPLGSRGGLR